MFWIPARLNKSDTKCALIRWSKGVSQASEGDKFTSSSHGFSSSSIITSKPNSWKQLLRCGTYISWALWSKGSLEIIVLMMMSRMRANNLSSLT